MLVTCDGTENSTPHTPPPGWGSGLWGRLKVGLCPAMKLYSYFQATRSISLSTKAPENAAEQLTIAQLTPAKQTKPLEMERLGNALFCSSESRSVSEVSSVLHRIFGEGQSQHRKDYINRNKWKPGDKILSCKKLCSRHHGSGKRFRNPCWRSKGAHSTRME